MSVSVVYTDKLYRPDPKVIPLSQAIKANGFIFVMGCGARNIDGSLEGDDIRAQARKALSNAKGILEASGASLKDVVRIESYLVNLEDTDGFNEVYREFIKDDPPSRCLLFIKGFRDPKMLVEVVVTAADPNAK
jgi:enamine deaminase RidA (YjgF/YER057c/UK114 family)